MDVASEKGIPRKGKGFFYTSSPQPKYGTRKMAMKKSVLEDFISKYSCKLKECFLP